jgi:sulfhydrogenase subunit delta
MNKLRLAVHKFASCDGCQLQFLTLEQELLTLAERVDIAYFVEASSDLQEGPYDVSFVEGSVSTPEEIKRIRQIRAQSRQVIAIGACATGGGIQALRNWGRHEAFLKAVYATPEYIESLEHSTPFSDHIRIDAELWGCPPDQGQLKRMLADLMAGVTPYMSGESVCLQCKRQGNVCVLVAKGEPCLGPVTRTGCGALCPHQERDCYGCFGPQAGGNTTALGRRFLGLGLSPEAIMRRYRFIYNWEPTFREASREWETQDIPHPPLPLKPERELP